MTRVSNHPMHGVLELDRAYVVKSGDGRSASVEIWKDGQWETRLASFSELERFCGMTLISAQEALRRMEPSRQQAALV